MQTNIRQNVGPNENNYTRDGEVLCIMQSNVNKSIMDYVT
jgi:hypothetical protein